MAKKKVTKQKTERLQGGCFWTNPVTGYLYAVYQYRVPGNPIRQKAQKRVPPGSTDAQAWKLLEKLITDTKAKVERQLEAAPAVEDQEDIDLRKVGPYKLTWQILGNWFKQHYAKKPRFVNRRLTEGRLSWRSMRWTTDQVVERLGPNKLVRDLTTLQIEKYKAARFNDPIEIAKKKRDPITNKVVKVKGEIVWETITRDRSFASVHHELRIIRQLLNHALAHDCIDKSPWKKSLIKTKDETERDRVATPAEEAMLLDQSDHSRRHHLMIYLTVKFDSGCRSSELRRLLVKDVDFERNEFLVYSYKGPHRNERLIPITPRARLALLECCNAPGKGPNSHVFTYNLKNKKTGEVEYRPLQNPPKTSWQTAKRLAKWWSDGAINLDNLREHDIRHTTITRWATSGELSDTEIMLMTGHTDMATYLRYVNPNHEQRQRAANVLHQIHQKHLEASVVENVKRKASAPAKLKRKRKAA